MLLKILAFALYTNSLSSTGFVEQIISILRILCYNSSLVTWTVVWPPSSLSLLYFLCLAPPCPIFRPCSFSWFFMNSTCCLNNFVIQSYTYGRLKAVCKSRTGVRLGKYQMARRTSFYWRFGTGRTENISLIIACFLVAGKTTCPQSCFLATSLLPSHVYSSYLEMDVQVTLYNVRWKKI
jgi:hypothetical protein